jgi:cytochrome c-type biogenesis protein
LLAYSAGLSLPFVLMGLAYSRLVPAYRWLRRYSPAISYASGAFLILMGILVFTDSVTQLNNYFDFGLSGTSV